MVKEGISKPLGFLSGMEFGKILTIRSNSSGRLSAHICIVQQPSQVRFTYKEATYELWLPYVTYTLLPVDFVTFKNHKLDSLWYNNQGDMYQFFSKQFNPNDRVYLNGVFLSSQNPLAQVSDVSYCDGRGSFRISSPEHTLVLLGGEIPNTYYFGDICHGAGRYNKSCEISNTAGLADQLLGFWGSGFNADLDPYRLSQVSREFSNTFGVRVGSTYRLYEMWETLDRDSVLKVFENINNRLTMQFAALHNGCQSKVVRDCILTATRSRRGLELGNANFLYKVKRFDGLFTEPDQEVPM